MLHSRGEGSLVQWDVDIERLPGIKIALHSINPTMRNLRAPQGIQDGSMIQIMTKFDRNKLKANPGRDV